MNTVGKRHQYYFFHAYVLLHALCVNILIALVTDKCAWNRDKNYCPPLRGLQTITATDQLTTKTTIANVESIECTVRRSWIRDVNYVGVVDSLYNCWRCPKSKQMIHCAKLQVHGRKSIFNLISFIYLLSLDPYKGLKQSNRMLK